MQTNRIELHDNAEKPSVKPTIHSSPGQNPKSKAAKRKERERERRSLGKYYKKVSVSFTTSWGQLRRIRDVAASLDRSLSSFLSMSASRAADEVLNLYGFHPYGGETFKPKQIKFLRERSKFIRKSKSLWHYPEYIVGRKRGMSPN